MNDKTMNDKEETSMPEIMLEGVYSWAPESLRVSVNTPTHGVYTTSYIRLVDALGAYHALYKLDAENPAIDILNQLFRRIDTGVIYEALIENDKTEG